MSIMLCCALTAYIAAACMLLCMLLHCVMLVLERCVFI
jgi:hypothetical protein